MPFQKQFKEYKTNKWCITIFNIVFTVKNENYDSQFWQSIEKYSVILRKNIRIKNI